MTLTLFWREIFLLRAGSPALTSTVPGLCAVLTERSLAAGIPIKPTLGRIAFLGFPRKGPAADQLAAYVFYGSRRQRIQDRAFPLSAQV